jgi:DNA-binding MarR family transcriptional regulator
MKTELNAANCTCFNLRKAARLVAQTYDHHLQPSGLKNTQFSLLQVASKQGPISITDLAAQLAMDRTTLTRNLKPLVRDRFIDIVPGKDARTRNIRVTAHGLRTLKNATPMWEAAQMNLLGKLGTTHWRSLLKELKTVLGAVKAVH